MENKATPRELMRDELEAAIRENLELFYPQDETREVWIYRDFTVKRLDRAWNWDGSGVRPIELDTLDNPIDLIQGDPLEPTEENIEDGFFDDDIEYLVDGAMDQARELAGWLDEEEEEEG
jgi:hypothetical protein